MATPGGRNAQRILKPDQAHARLVPVEETYRKLEELNGTLTVCSVVGTQRGGKSTLLNLLHSRSMKDGFAMGHYMDPQTAGLWMMLRPHPRKENHHILFLDTEGLDSPHVAPFYNWSLAALALLISDVFIYQSKGSIDQNAIDQLDVILRVAEQLRGDWSPSADAQEGKKKDTGNTFMWLLRDHHLTMRSAPKEEMLEKLDASATRTLRRCFEEYDCFPLPAPLSDAAALREMDKKSFDDLAGPFKEEFVVLERRLLERLRQTRILGGVEVTGKMVATLLRKYSEAVTEKKGAIGDIAALPTQRQMLLRMAGEKALQSALKHYAIKLRDAAKSNFPVDLPDLVGLHTKTLAEARKIFFGIVGQTDFDLDSEETAAYKAMLERKISDWKTFTTSIVSDSALSAAPPKEQDINGIGDATDTPGALEPDQGAGISSLCQRVTLSGGYYQQAWKLNQKASLKVCSAVLGKLYGPLHDAVVSETPPSLKEFNERYEKVKADYDAYPKAAGPSKRHCLASLEKGVDVVSDTGNVLLSYDYPKDYEIVMQSGARKALQEVASEAKAYTERSVGETAERLSKEAHEMVAMAEVHMAKEIAERFGELESSLTAKIDALAKSLEESKQREDALEKSLGESKRREDALQSEIDAMKTQMAVAAERAQERHEWISKGHEELKGALAARAAEAKEQAAALSTRCDVIAGDVVSLRSEVKQQESASTQKVAALSQSIADAELQIAGVKETMSSALSDHDAKLGALDEKFSDVSSSAQSISVIIEEIKAGFAASEASQRDASATLRADIEAVQAKAASLTQTQAESETGVKEEFAKTKEQIKAVIQKLGASVKARGEDVEALKVSIGEQQSDVAAKIADVKEQLLASEQKLASSVGKLESDLAANAESMVAAVENVKQSVAATVASQQEESEAVKAEIAAAVNRLEDVHAKAEELSQVQAQGESGVREEFAKTKEQLKTVIQTIAAAVKERGEEVAALKIELGNQKSGLEAQVADVRSEVAGSGEQLSSKIGELASSQATFDEKLKGILANAQAINATIENITEAVKQQAANQRDASAALKAELASEVAPRLDEVQAKADAAAQAANKSAARFDRGLKQLKDNAASLWESLGQLACRLTEFEALADR